MQVKVRRKKSRNVADFQMISNGMERVTTCTRLEQANGWQAGSQFPQGALHSHTVLRRLISIGRCDDAVALLLLRRGFVQFAIAHYSYCTTPCCAETRPVIRLVIRRAEARVADNPLLWSDASMPDCPNTPCALFSSRLVVHACSRAWTHPRALLFFRLVFRSFLSLSPLLRFANAKTISG